MKAQISDGRIHWPIYIRQKEDEPWQDMQQAINLCPTDALQHHGDFLAELKRVSGFGERVKKATMIVRSNGGRQSTLADLAWGLTLS